MVLIQHLYGLPSLRRTAEEVSANNCYRWFLGYPLQEETPHFSTVSYNFRHRFTEETVDRVFAWILDEVAKAGYAQLYKCRKETIERVFADAKEKHAMRYTQYRGLAQVTNWVKLKFAAMNLKKLATWKWRDLLPSFRFAVFSLIYVRDPVCS